MKSSAKKRILLILVILVIIIVAIVVWKSIGKEETNKIGEGVSIAQEDSSKVEEYVQVLDDGSKLNTSSELQSEKTIDGLKITNIQLRESGGITTLLADVENTTGKKSDEKMIKISILDKEGKKITDVKGIIDAVEAGKSVQLNISVTADVANAYDFKISEE